MVVVGGVSLYVRMSRVRGGEGGGSWDERVGERGACVFWCLLWRKVRLGGLGWERMDGIDDSGELRVEKAAGA